MQEKNTFIQIWKPFENSEKKPEYIIMTDFERSTLLRWNMN
jgi:hypothetical protein